MSNFFPYKNVFYRKMITEVNILQIFEVVDLACYPCHFDGVIKSDYVLIVYRKRWKGNVFEDEKFLFS